MFFNVLVVVGLLVRLEQFDILFLDLVNRIDDFLLLAELCSYLFYVCHFILFLGLKCFQLKISLL